MPCRRERKLGDVTYKLKRGAFDTPPLGQSSDSSDDNQEDGPPTHHAHSATPTSKHEQNLDVAGTPVSGKGGKKRIWRKRRRQSNSNSKDDKTKDSGFLEKFQNKDHQLRRQSLPPLTNLLSSQISHGTDHTPSTPTLLDNNESGAGGGVAAAGEAVDGVSRDSTPRPKHQPETPLTPNGSFSHEVSELIESLKHPSRHHRRNGSNGSLRTHRRQGSNGSATSGRGLSLETTPLRSSPPNPSSKRTSLELSGSRRGSATGCGGPVPYSKMDAFTSAVSDSENGGESREEEEVVAVMADDSATSALSGGSGGGGGGRVPFPKLVPGSAGLSGGGGGGGDGGTCRKASPRHADAAGRDIYSNESSMDTHDGSDAEEAGNEADGESTSDGYENRLDRLSCPEPNETTAESYVESSNSVASRSTPAESDDVTSCSETSNLISKPHSTTMKDWNQTTSHHVTPDFAFMSADQSHFGLGSHDTALAMPPSNLMLPLLELPLESDDDVASESSLTGLTIPMHIRRNESPRRKDDGKWSPNPKTSIS